jgi:N utilization substance protein B
MLTYTPEFEPDERIETIPVTDERSLARRMALQIFYEVDSAHHDVNEVMAIHLQSRQPSKKVARYTQHLITGIIENQSALDDVIRRFAPEWPLEQIAIIDRNILRMAIYEFAVEGRTPVGVAIDEAVNLAKIFGSDGAPSFINGVLGALADDETTIQKLRIPHEDES